MCFFKTESTDTHVPKILFGDMMEYAAKLSQLQVYSKENNRKGKTKSSSLGGDRIHNSPSQVFTSFIASIATSFKLWQTPEEKVDKRQIKESR
jgi:hypothetical protein